MLFSPKYIKTCLLLVLVILFITDTSTGRARKRRRSLSRRPISRADSSVNILFVKASTVHVGFNYVQGSHRFYVSAREWVDGSKVGNEAYGVWLRQQERSTTVRKLLPGREYIIQVQAYGKVNNKVGGLSQKVVRTSQECYICNGKKSNEACKGFSNTMECPHDKDACLNEVRYSKGVPKVTKRCAQWRPELGKQIQNGKDITKACTGRENLKDVACKCMCRSHLCNEVAMPCINECFKELPIPEFSYLKCSKEEKIGSKCRWHCIPGYKIKGTRVSECRKDRTWSVLLPPECVFDPDQPVHDKPEHTCPLLDEPKNAFMSCTNLNNPGSYCTFTCSSQYFIKGTSSRTCEGSSSKWSGEQPYCVEVKCIAIEGENGLTKECTADESVGSVCDFSCPTTRKFVGKTSLTCLPGGKWSSAIPKCTPPDCGIEPNTFPNVLMECSPIPGRKTGKVCQFSCEEGYERRGAQKTFCYSGNSWTAGSPTCRRIMCRPDMYPPVNGFVRCNDRAFYDSTCKFSCKAGYLLQGVETTHCGNGGKWSNLNLPTCKRIKCPKIIGFNGFYSCNNGQNFGSVCMFSCKRGFGFEEGTETKLKCVEKTLEELEITRPGQEVGKWSNEIPRCIVVGCPPLGKAPEHSTVKCTGATPRGAGTICTYRCDKGYNLVGSARTTCVARSDGSAAGDWSSLPPSCERVTCKVLSEIKFGTVDCTDENFAGSKCTVDCDYGRILVGKKVLSCNTEGYWSGKFPLCKLVTCSSEPSLKNGIYNCGDLKKYKFNHECEATCNTGFELSQPGAAICGVKGNWLTSDLVTCTDLNECLALDKNGLPTNGNCEHYCVNTVGSYECQCKENYQLNPDGKTCKILICPSLEAVQKGRIACTNTNRIGSVCSLRCVPGFETSDVQKVICLKKGSWNKEMGMCTRISCPDLVIPESGYMECTKGYKFGSDCDFECEEGFHLKGKPSTRCGADGKWTYPVPVCEIKTCDVGFLTILNALVECTDENRYESMCQAKCEEGYELATAKDAPEIFVTKIHCTEDATWSSAKPKCVKKRCEPSLERLIMTRRNGKISCTNDDWLGSACELSCDKGYIVEGPFRIVCSGDADWSKTLGKCRKVQCPKISAPANGDVVCTEATLYQSTCSFQCDEGYEMKGATTTECSHDRTWTQKTPFCDRIMCSKTFMKLLKGSTKCSEDSLYGSVCEYRCDPGYEFVDTETDIRKSFGVGLDEGISYDIIRLSCLATGLWGGEKPACERHECIPPSIVLQEAESNGKITCSNGDKYESVCELSCDKGYEIMEGRASTQCSDTREWKPALGRCQRIRCQMFEPLINGAVQCSRSNQFESRCLFGCFPGYKLIGSPVSYCQWNKKFTHDVPRCEKIFCPTTHIKLINGDATCTDGARFQSECVYVCDPGYEMEIGGKVFEEESVVLRCMSTSRWGGKLPVCKRKQCSLHDGAIAKARLNGDVTCTATVYTGSVCSVKCHDGYQLVGSAQTSCNNDADWEPAIGFCERISCPPMVTPKFGSKKCTNQNKYQSICTFKCNYGYELIGYDNAECLSMEYFSSEAPTCKEILCPDKYLDLKDGEVTCSNKNKLASRCLYKCDSGYQLTDESVDSVECQKTYTWTDEKPKCIRKVCPQGEASLIRAAEFGTLTCTNSNKYESICSVTCYPGYRLTQGGAFTECRADQQWGPDLGYCTKITCNEFVPLDNGTIECTDGLRFKSVCSFDCEPGFELTHNKSTVCQADKTFTVKAPDCRKIDCPSYHMRIHNGKAHCTDGNKFGSICKYECNEGFERVTGSASAQCLSDRTWDADKTGCERIQCDGSDILLIKAKEHGTVKCTSSNFYGSVCKVECDQGYELTGMAVGTTTCNEFAQWDGKLGYCTRIICEEYEAPENGNVTCTIANRYKSECIFTCNTGYEMKGESVTTCQADRSWTNKRPKCIKITCSDTNLFLENGKAYCNDENRYLSVCIYECAPGYEMDEDIPHAMCTSSRAWTRNKPTCVKIECNFGEEMITTALQNGGIKCTDGVRYESVCTLTCDEGYELKGRGQIECTANALWDKKIGYCEKIRCEALKIPANAKMDCTDTNRYESICAFACDEGYELEGNDESQCLSNGSFSNAEPSCLKTRCSIDNLSLPYGTVVCTDKDYFMSVCAYECHVGYRMSAGIPENQESTCLSNQTWSVEIPICEKKICPHDAPHLLKALEHGDIKCTEGNRYGSVCSVTCDLGYELKGNESTECTESSKWSNKIGHCEKIQCDGLKTPSSAIKSCTDKSFFNSTCSFSCNGGYRFTNADFLVEDEVTLTCLATRTWTAPAGPPMCTRESCPIDMLKLENGNIGCTDKAYFGSQCLFKCNDGYELVEPSDDFDVTSIIVTCGRNETWDATSRPTCRRITCNEDMQLRDKEMSHGGISCTDDSKFESECTITCNKGYEIVNGETKTTCMSDKTWGPQLGVCTKISCPVLVAPEDSTLLCSESFLFKSLCKVICRPGFEIYNPEDDYDPDKGLECKADGDWCGDVPTCTRVRCPVDNMALDGGIAECVNENLFESECRYTCQPGYQMVQGQKDTTQCTAHMTWSSPAPTCEKRRCPANDSSIKEAQANGEVLCTEENKFDSVCELKCMQGYELSGEPNTTCLHTGDWNHGIGLCNKKRCGEVSVPKNAIMKCSDNNRYESLCTFACKPGYMLTEASLKSGNGIVCQANKKWEGEIIQCEKITCPSQGYDKLEYGEVKCNDSNYYTSRCLFSCSGGYELEVQVDPEDRSTAVVNCTELGYWDVPKPPKCQRVQCEPSYDQLNENFENGDLRCPRGSVFGSKCTAKCNQGYKFYSGASVTTCGSDRKWGKTLGKCEKILCVPLENIRFGTMVCDDGFRYMSQCVYECLPGYEKILQGKNSRGVAVCRADGTWSGQAPICKKAKCNPIYLRLRDGNALCSDKNLYNSECEYSCDAGYEIAGEGSNIVRCTEEGTWSEQQPSCKVKTCTSAYAPNGHMNCTGTGYNAVCKLDCQVGHKLIGADYSTCTDVEKGETTWTPPIGVCEKMRCPAVPELRDGSVRCSDENKYRSVCFVNCHHGYEVKGVYLSTRCLSDGTWSLDFQKCERVKCDASYLIVDYGKVTATDANNFGSVLEYSCPNFGHKMTGSSTVTCLVNGKWSRQKPRCEKYSCPPINLPNGYVHCSGKRYNDFQSQCSYGCNENYQRIGSSSTKCQINGMWSNPPPYCKGHCDIHFNSLEYGGVECTNSHYHHSKCRFWCDSQPTSMISTKYSIFGNDFLTCKQDGQWDGMPPCCAQNCPPWGKMDLFLVFDSGSSSNYQNWQKLLKFAVQILDNFYIGNDNVLAGAIRYYRDVDTRSEIPIGKLKNKGELERAIKFLPFGGWGSKTGEALDYVSSKSLSKSGNRRGVSDIVILFTDGISQDDVTNSVARLKAKGVTIHVVAIEGPKGINFENLAKIASHPLQNHLSIISGELTEQRSKDLSDKFGSKLCGNPCLLNADYRKMAQKYIQKQKESSQKSLKKSDFII